MSVNKSWSRQPSNAVRVTASAQHSSTPPPNARSRSRSNLISIQSKDTKRASPAASTVNLPHLPTLLADSHSVTLGFPSYKSIEVRSSKFDIRFIRRELSLESLTRRDMKKEDLRNLAIFLVALIIVSPVIYYTACWMFSYDVVAPPKAQSFGPLFNYRIGETLPAGNALPCPVIPTSLCQGNFYLVPVAPSNMPTQL